MSKKSIREFKGVKTAKAKDDSQNPACYAALRVICPKHGEQEASAFVIWAAMVLRCGCKVTSMNEQWKWNYAE